VAIAEFRFSNSAVLPSAYNSPQINTLRREAVFLSQGRFFDRAVRNVKEYVEYMHLNP
jgi:hypothetical protein